MNNLAANAGVVRPVPFHRLGLIARNTLREAVRQRVFAWMLILAVGLVVGAQFLRDLNFGAPELKFMAELGFGGIGMFGAVLTVTATAQLFFSELEQRTALTLLARPVGRTEFVLGKFFGAMAVVTIFCATLTGLLAAVLWSREATLMREFPAAFPAGHVVNYGWIFATGLLLWLKLIVLGGFTLLVASYAQTQLFTVATGFLLFVVGHLQHLAHEAAGRMESAVVKSLATALVRMVPDFQFFVAVEGAGEGTVAWAHAGRVSAYAMGYTALACVLAVLCFRRREL